MADLTFTLGTDAQGHPVTADLARLPHLLIGGVAGSGKTWCIDSICTQLDGKIDLLRFEPDDAEAALVALREAAAALPARCEGEQRPLVIVIDEYSSLMHNHSQEVNDLIGHIAPHGRLAGIHLILTTQKLYPEVITGMMRANIPSRIAFRTATADHSRILLDHTGAELLHRPGDALYYPIVAEKSIPLHVQ